MFKLSEDYYLRKCYIKSEQVPTQSVMIKKMSAPLANVYFKSMSPKLKVLAGLEPPLKGGGNDWYIPPKSLLEEGRTVLKPLKKELLSKLSSEGICYFGEKLLQVYHERMEKQKKEVLFENDINWKKTIEIDCRKKWEDSSKEVEKRNTRAIEQAFQEFTALYMASINKIEILMFDAAVKEITKTNEETYQMMQNKYENFLKKQATRLYDKYTQKLLNEKCKLKNEFIDNVDHIHKSTADRVHDLNVEKHIAIEKLRNLLECQNLACQVYVALKEREECQKEIELSEYEHKKKIYALKEEIALKDFEIQLAIEKEKKRQEFQNIWKKKVCVVIKKFQQFVSYCLFALPGHADFFLDMEKLMLLQLNNVIEDPSAASIFEHEEPEFHTPVPRPHPFYLFCDKGYKPQLDQNLCPKHCTSSASQMPVIVVNKRCIYAACDNIEQFTNKVEQYIHGKRGDDADFKDEHFYGHDIPIKYTSTQQLLELKLESSLLQVLQQELPNVRKVPTECCVCKIPHCFCSPMHASKMSLDTPQPSLSEMSEHSISFGNKIETRSVELMHEREPKWASYCKYIEPSRCKCGKTAKKHLREHLPPYMQNLSAYNAPELPHYETCSLVTLKRIVEKARGKLPTPPTIVKEESKTKEVGTQYSDQEFDSLCNCFSDEEVEKLLKQLVSGTKVFDSSNVGNKFKMVDGNLTPTFLTKDMDSFATARAFSLRNLINDAPQLEEIFIKEDCRYN